MVEASSKNPEYDMSGVFYTNGIGIAELENERMSEWEGPRGLSSTFH